MPNKSSPHVMTGARAVIYVNSEPIASFIRANWAVRQEKVAMYILGRYNPADIITVSQEPVRISATGVRIVGHGPYQDLHATMLKKILSEEERFTVKVFDRKSQEYIFTALNCTVESWTSGVTARAVSDITVDIIGEIGYDEYAGQSGDSEEISATSLPVPEK